MTLLKNLPESFSVEFVKERKVTTEVIVKKEKLMLATKDISVASDKKNDDPEIKTNSSESNSVQSNVKDISKSFPGSVSKLNVNSSCPGTLTARKSTSSSGPVLGDKVSLSD